MCIRDRVRLVPFNNLYFFLAIILALLSLWSPYPALLLSVLTLVTPIGLDFKHRTSKVNITERLKRLNIIYCILVVLISIVSLSMDLGYFLALVVNLFSFYSSFIIFQCGIPASLNLSSTFLKPNEL